MAALSIIAIALGIALIAALFAVGVVAMSRINGWKLTLQIWAASALVTAIAVAAALLIGCGAEHL